VKITFKVPAKRDGVGLKVTGAVNTKGSFLCRGEVVQLARELGNRLMEACAGLPHSNITLVDMHVK
jgi:hypothetical protein